MTDETDKSDIKQRILFIADVEKLIGRSRMTLRRWYLKGDFPLPIKLNDSTLAWHSDAIENWINITFKKG